MKNPDNTLRNIGKGSKRESRIGIHDETPLQSNFATHGCKQ